MSTTSPDSEEPPKMPTPEMWIQVLESTANAPWLAQEHTSSDRATPPQRLERAYSRIFQSIMYLGRPQEEEAAAQNLDVSLIFAPTCSLICLIEASSL